MGRFCAICADDIPEHGGSTEPLGKNGALVLVCSDCNDEPAREKRGPDRSYEPSSPSLHSGTLVEKVRRGAMKVMGPGRVGKKFGKALHVIQSITNPSPGHIILRTASRDETGRALDNREGRETLHKKHPGKHLRYLGRDHRYMLFETPDPNAKVKPDEPDLAGDLERMSKKR